MSSNQQQNEGSRPKYKRKFRNYLLDAGFQLKWTMIVVIVNIVICVLLSIPLYQTVSDASDQLLAKNLGEPALTMEAMQALETQNQKDKSNTIWKIAIFLGLLVVASTMAWIILTHKIAGPLYKIKKIFKGVDGNKLELNARFRKGDEFEHVMDDFNSMMERLAQGRTQDIKIIQKAIEVFEKSSSDDERSASISELKELIKRYQASLE